MTAAPDTMSAAPGAVRGGVPGAAPDADEDRPPRADLVDAAGWLLLGTATLAGSLMMDRLEDQDVPPFGAPGLMPGLLGLLLLLMGAVLFARSVRRGALASTRFHVGPVHGGPVHEGLVNGGPVHGGPALPAGRALLVIGLCVVFGTVLVGHGLPFWAAAASFVAVCILLLRQGHAGERPAPTLRSVVTAIVIGLAAGFGITLVFQQIFLVRLP